MSVEIELPQYHDESLAKVFKALDGDKQFEKKSEVILKKESDWELAKKDFEKKYGRPMNENEIAIFQPRQV